MAKKATRNGSLQQPTSVSAAFHAATSCRKPTSAAVVVNRAWRLRVAVQLPSFALCCWPVFMVSHTTLKHHRHNFPSCLYTCRPPVQQARCSLWAMPAAWQCRPPRWAAALRHLCQASQACPVFQLLLSVSHTPLHSLCALIHLDKQGAPAASGGSVQRSTPGVPACIAWHPQHLLLAVGWADGPVSLWDAAHGRHIEVGRQDDSKHSPAAAPTQLIWHPSGQHLLTTDAHGKVSCEAVFCRPPAPPDALHGSLFALTLAKEPSPLRTRS